ncbi:MAG: formate--tetrahydrofolate ligase, partial [Peptococcaceae bacterium]|nr:formate--tetrahydrofolate ligase [Peptococcaceae bacterium]
GVNVALSEVWGKGSEGGKALAEEVVRLAEAGAGKLQFTYDVNESIMDKINAVVTKIYHGAGVDYTPAAQKEIKRLEELGYDKLPVCMAKTQYSFSDNQNLLGAPEGFRVTISNVKVSAGAGFVVVYTGDIMTMPGLPKVPSAEKIDVDNDGVISGLF